MKAFVTRGLLFLLPLLGLSVSLFYWPREKVYDFQVLQDHCWTGLWIWNRIYEDPRPIDVAFVGTSRTVTSVRDGELEDVWSDLSREGLHVANLGFCRPGRNLHFHLVKELIRTKKPKVIVLEVGVDEDRFSHPDFAYVANGSDLLFPYLIFNQNIPRDLKHGFIHRVLYTRSKVFGIAVTPDSVPLFKPHLFRDWASEPVLDPSATYQAGRWASRSPFSTWVKKNIETRFADHYVKKISRLCQKYNVSLYLLYLPPFPEPPGTRPILETTYRQAGIFLRAPDSLLNRPQYYRDLDAHMAPKGSARLRDWLAETLKTDLQSLGDQD